MAASAAERAKRYRKRVRLRRRLGLALVDANRLAEWDEDDRAAIDEARDLLLEDWIAGVTCDGVDPVRRNILRDES